MTTDGKSPGKVALKAMQGSPEGVKNQERGTWPCRFWLSEAGCRQGQRRRWPHSWEGVADKAARCWLCSSLQHQQQDCPTKTQAKQPVGGDQEGGKKDAEGKREGGKSKGKGKTKGKIDNKPKEPSSAEDKKDEKASGEDNKPKTTAKPEQGGESKPETGATGGTAELLQEATKLLKSLHLPTVKMISMKEVTGVQTETSGQVLVDSGATHALRRARDWKEWEAALPTLVALAQGTTDRLRVKEGTNVLLSTPNDESFGTGIIPMGELTKLGYVVHWNDGSCQLQAPGGRHIDMKVVNGCPMVDQVVGMKLIDEVEKENKIAQVKAAMVKTMLRSPELVMNLPGVDPEVVLTVLLKGEFPDLPDTIIGKVVPRMKTVQGEDLPWNRRRRRQIDKAKRVVLHLYSGKDEKSWKELENKETVVLCVDKLLHPGMNMMGDSVMQYLLKVAAQGKIAAVIGGPPCRTVSACRYQDSSSK